jgi:CP family cyanate transporter-like MFS transporter
MTTPVKQRIPVDQTIPVPRRALAPAFLGITVVVLALTFRAPILSASPLVDTIRDSTGISSATAGLLTTIPVICFGLISPLAPALARRFGMERVLAGVLLLLIAGILARTAAPLAMLFGGTVVLGAAIAIGNVILPGFIKREAPTRIGPMTSLYSMAISGSGALGAGLTVPLMHALDLGWRGALGLWAAPALAGLLVLLPWLAHARAGGSARTRHTPVRSLWRNGLAWQVTIYMGSQSLLFFATAAWLPTLFIDHGISDQRAGFLLSLLSIVGVGGAFAGPLLANRRPTQQIPVAISAACAAGGALCLLTDAVALAVPAMVLYGLALGSALSLALTMIGLRSPDALHAAELSGMAQTVGYLVAAVGPLLVGFLYDLTGGWTAPLVLLLIAVVPMLASGLGAGRDLLVAPPAAAIHVGNATGAITGDRR